MLRLRLSIAFLLLLAGCGGGGGGTGPGPAPPNQSNGSVHLAGGPGGGVQALNLAIQKVEVNGPQGWISVATPAAVFSITTLVDGSTAALSSNGTLAQGSYSSLRLTLGQGSTAQLSGGSTLPLASVSQVFVVPLQLTVSSSPVDLTLCLDPGRSIQRRDAALLFVPDLRALDRNASGSISGRITDAAGQPISGTLVTAQSFPAFGDPTILRRAVTKSDGTYTLDLLPFGTACYAVCFPKNGSTVLEPVASPAFTPTAGAASTTFTPAPDAMKVRADLGSTSGTVTPVTNGNQGDEIQLVFGPILAGGTPQIFIIGTSPGNQQGAAETWAFTGLPAGSTYQLRATRRTWGADGSFSEQRKFSEDYAFLSGLDFPYAFQF